MHGYSIRQMLDLLLREIGREEFIVILKSAALWGMLGAGLGLLVSFAAYRGFRRCRWYDATTPAGRWTQRGLVAASALLCAGLAGAAGLWEGVHRQCHDVVVRSRIGTDALPAAAGFLAEGFVWIDLTVQQGGSLARAAEDPRLEAFRAGTWELDAPAFLQRIDTLRESAFQEILRQLEQAMLEKSPGLEGGFTGQILHRTLQELGPVLLNKKLSDEMHRRGLDHLQAALRDRLVAEAARTGNPATIGSRDLSAFILNEGLVPAIVAPVRSFARQQQIICACLALLLCLLPAALCRVCRGKPAPSPDMTGGPTG